MTNRSETKNFRALYVAEAFVSTLDALLRPELSEFGVAEAWVSTEQSEPYAAVTVIMWGKKSTIYRLSVPEQAAKYKLPVSEMPTKGNRRVIEFNVPRDVEVVQVRSGIETLLKGVGAAINASKQDASGIARYEVRNSTEERPPAATYGDNIFRNPEQPEVARTIFQLSPAALDRLYAALSRANGGLPPFPQPIHTAMTYLNQ